MNATDAEDEERDLPDEAEQPPDEPGDGLCAQGTDGPGVPPAGSRVTADDDELRGLMSSVVDRDERALGRLYDVLVGRVFGIALRITRNPATAEEVAEDTFWQVWRQAPRFDPERGNVTVWVMTIARSRALDAVRRLAAERCTDSIDDTAELAVVDPRGSPHDLLAAVQDGHLLDTALKALDPLPRQLVALAFFRGMSHEEIAGHMDLPLGTVKSHIRRSLVSMRQSLSPT